MTDKPNPHTYFGGPWDGNPVTIDEIPLAEIEEGMWPSKILTGWDTTGAYVWQAGRQRYEWTP